MDAERSGEEASRERLREGERERERDRDRSENEDEMDADRALGFCGGRRSSSSPQCVITTGESGLSLSSVGS